MNFVFGLILRIFSTVEPGPHPSSIIEPEIILNLYQGYKKVILFVKETQIFLNPNQQL